ncbi:hypothetical protein DY000_02014928 [Brassica cretica]|uniref:Uncharacterized protein n=1 Tax=Brassica cretica TaxID=69181 RepID=A0ABQ7CTF0_BRACR|nr:hypothetical protein DY000_02014928 [Brassica cretica]
MYMSKASHLDVPKHQRPPIWMEEAAGFHKRVKKIHDPVKIMVPCDVFEAESHVSPDKSIQKSRVHSRCFSQPFAKLRALLIAEMVDKREESMEEAFTQE